MFALKILRIAAILALAAGCETTGSTARSGSPKWAVHEELSRTYHSRCTMHARDPVVAFGNEDTSRVYEACCPAILDEPNPMWAAHEELSRTYHSCCPMVPDDQTPQSFGEEPQPAIGVCAGPEREGDCLHCAR